MPAYRLDLRYVGTGFHGWQSQPSGNSIQDVVEKALATLLRHPVRLTAAARTDSGVHAEHQVAVFKTDVPPDERRWLKGLYGLLPESIGVTRLAPVDTAFHPNYAAKGKAYCYRLWLGAARHPFLAPYVWTLHRELDLAAMGAAAAHLVGTHDFTSFCALDSSAKTRTRTVTAIEVVATPPLVEIWVLGEGFLKQMVRNMVGTLVDVGAGKTTPGSVPEVLAARSRAAAGATAPAEGLTLVEVFYEALPSAAALLTSRRNAVGWRVD